MILYPVFPDASYDNIFGFNCSTALRDYSVNIAFTGTGLDIWIRGWFDEAYPECSIGISTKEIYLFESCE